MPGFTCVYNGANGKSIDPKHLCSSCEKVLRDPVQTSCGHRYCKTCVEPLSRSSSSKCLVDDEDIGEQKIFEDKFAQREILSLPVQCANHCDGCDWSGELGQLEKHESQCLYAKIQCVHPGCSAMVRKNDLPQHLVEECSCREQQCQYCEVKITANRLEEHHEKECQEYAVECLQCKTVILPRKQLSSHLDPVDGDCEGVEAPCPFHKVGCKQKKTMKQKERRRHQEKEVTAHLTYLFLFVDQLSNLFHSKLGDVDAGALSKLDAILRNLQSKVDAIICENSNLTSMVQGHSTRISNLEQSIKRYLMDDVVTDSAPLASLAYRSSQAEIVNILQKLDNQDAKTANHEVLLVEFNSEMQNRNREIKRLQAQLKTANDEIRKLQRQTEYLEHTLGARNIAIAELEDYVRQEQFSSYNGVLLWKITDFTRKRNEARSGQHVSTYSPCFYTSRHGYKMCARIYLNGDGIGKGTHFSIFFVVMRGEYDAILRWPFRQKVTFMLLDQDNVEHVVDAFRPDPSSSSFQRPKRDMNIASGCPTFCAMTQLNNHAYVKDDTMFIKVIVDTGDL
nr:TNF receptor-associated factor 3-like [Pocillopora verrucosa]